MENKYYNDYDKLLWQITMKNDYGKLLCKITMKNY